MSRQLTRVLVVDDSRVSREFLVHLLESASDVQVVGVAADGQEALEAVRRLRPDVITMDIHMPRMDGLEATRLIMETKPTPIVIVSGSSPPSEVATTFATVDAGALAVLARPDGPGHPNHETSTRKLIETVRLMSEVKVVRRWARKGHEAPAPVVDIRPPAGRRLRVVGLGASTGGPPTLRSILAGLPRNFPVPLVIVQHMSEGFVSGFCEWLAQSSGFPVTVASHGELMQPGHAYLAPDRNHLMVGDGDRLLLGDSASENGMKPAVSVLFRSIARVYGSAAVAGVLTGMGKDGAAELKQLRDLGAITLAQDKETSIVHGMPGEAIKLGAATMVLPQERIAEALVNVARGKVESRYGP